MAIGSTATIPAIGLSRQCECVRSTGICKVLAVSLIDWSVPRPLPRSENQYTFCLLNIFRYELSYTP